MTEIWKANPLNSLNQFKNIINKDVQNRRVLSISFHGYFRKQFTIEQRLVVKNNENMIKQHITLHMLLYVRLMTLMVLTYQCYRCLILQISALYQLLLDFNGCTWLPRIINLFYIRLTHIQMQQTQLNSRYTDSSPSAFRSLAPKYTFFAFITARGSLYMNARLAK